MTDPERELAAARAEAAGAAEAVVRLALQLGETRAELARTRATGAPGRSPEDVRRIAELRTLADAAIAAGRQAERRAAELETRLAGEVAGRAAGARERDGLRDEVAALRDELQALRATGSDPETTATARPRLAVAPAADHGDDAPPESPQERLERLRGELARACADAIIAPAAGPRPGR